MLDRKPRAPVTGRSTWSVDDVGAADSWTWTLTAEELEDLDSAIAHQAIANQIEPQTTGSNSIDTDDNYVEIRRESFALPRLAVSMSKWLDEIEDGRGFVVVRGIPTDRYSEAELYKLFWGLGCHLGTAIVQNYEGRRINEVRSRGHSYDAINIRAYATASHLGFHNDPSDLTCLLCVRQARAGGLSRIASASAVYNEILLHHPEFIELLHEGFHHDVRGEGPTGDFNEVTARPIPVFSYFKNKLSCCLNSKSIATARMKMGGALSELEQAALAYIEQRAMDPDLRLDFMLQPGDILMMNNYSVLHARTAFEDHEEPKRQRLLLRLWLNTHTPRTLAPEWDGRFNTGARGGAVVHEHNDGDLLDAGANFAGRA